MKSKAQDIIEVTIKWTYFRFTPVFLRRLPNAGLNPTWISKRYGGIWGVTVTVTVSRTAARPPGPPGPGRAGGALARRRARPACTIV